MSALLSWSIPVAEVRDAGKHVTWSASEAERQALARELSILDVTRFDCDVRLRPLRLGRYHARGTVKAAVVQACVVTLEPVAATVEEVIDHEFWPQADVPRPTSTAHDEWIDPEAPDEAEPIENGRLGIGRLAYELLAAGLDPYPRKPGAELAIKAKPEAIAEVHPFAALAKLKKPPG